MKNVSTLKSTKTETPKTPGGISKSLLTPCRRVGLSRNWKKAGPSPFVSPLSGGNPSVVEQKVEPKVSRKRKKCVQSEARDEIECTPEEKITDTEETVVSPIEELSSTPVRHVEVPHKKKSKSLCALNKKEKVREFAESSFATETPEIDNLSKGTTVIQESTSKENKNFQVDEKVSIPVKSKSKISISSKTSLKSKKQPLTEIASKENTDDKVSIENCKEKNDVQKTTSPKDLTKECIVVIQKKIFKTHKKNDKEDKKSQVLFDSDSDDVPLCKLNSNTDAKDTNNVRAEEVPSPKPQEIVNLDNDEDFIEMKSKIKKLEDKATSIGGLKKKPVKASTAKVKKPSVIPPTPVSQSSDFDDDDDFDFGNRKTILIRKTYEKTSKPLKAKSTGSITQRDIDELKARIETKKKLLLAKAMTEDTAELRSLVKKWQKGCQDALIELMELMSKKFPDRQNMDYKDMLSMLKIPPALVGYDSDNDCFNTPEDSNLILSKFNCL